MHETEKLRYDEVSDFIINLCSGNLDFDTNARIIQKLINSCSKEELLDHLDYSGIIPEIFGHDSTEEKLFAKYCDSLLAKALCELGLSANLISERGNAADVEGEGYDYKIVADAKSFRLSRTAKNQKDFKVEALNNWRKGADFACLVCPLSQYPNRSSQIYSQAIRYKVILLSYTHLAFMIRNIDKIKINNNLRELWEVSGQLQDTNKADLYWNAINSKTAELTSSSISDLKKAIDIDFARLKVIAKKQIQYLESEKKRISELSHEEAVKELIKMQKINSRINTIKKSANL